MSILVQKLFCLVLVSNPKLDNSFGAMITYLEHEKRVIFQHFPNILFIVLIFFKNLKSFSLAPGTTSPAAQGFIFVEDHQWMKHDQLLGVGQCCFPHRIIDQ